MPKIEGVIKLEIVRLTKRELRLAFLPLKRELRQMSLRLSGLSKGIGSLNRLAKDMGFEEAEPKLEATPEEVKASRLTAERISRLRRKLGLSQRELGILSGATTGAVLSWEKGKFKPRCDKKAALLALRKLKKRDVKKMLAGKAQASEKPKRKPTTKKLARKRIAKPERPTRRQREPATVNLRKAA
jgi:DNA-binding transcriptional regulator YiaG